MKVLLISSIVPTNTLGGSLKLYRHFANGGIGSVSVVSDGVVPGFEHAVIRHTLSSRVFKRLNHPRLSRWVWDMRQLFQPFSYDEIKSACASMDPDVILTLAHGDLWPYAMRLARDRRLPFVAVFDDWWSDLIPVHSGIRRLMDNRFYDLYKAADVALCICDGMQSALGSHRDARTLYPMPPAKNTKNSKPHTDKNPSKPVLVRYVGNLGEYGPMVGEALEAIRTRPDLRFEVRGPNPKWPAGFRDEMSRLGLWGDFIPRAELVPWLESADILLVAMTFDVSARRMVETSFPSKISEYVSHGKPIVVWGPEYCSAVRWARTKDSALCVTKPNPSALADAIASLKPHDLQRLAGAASLAAEQDFNPARIHDGFIRALQDAAQIKK